jgi:hypothetical protein
MIVGPTTGAVERKKRLHPTKGVRNEEVDRAGHAVIFPHVVSEAEPHSDDHDRAGQESVASTRPIRGMRND